MTIELLGDANLRPLELPAFSKAMREAFSIYPDEPEVERFIQSDRLFHKKNFSVALVPKKAGKLTIPPVEFTAFKPSTKSYYTLRTPERSISVTPSLSDEEMRISSPEPDSLTTPSPIESLGEDLLPQHIGARTFSPARRMSDAQRITLIIGILLLGVCGRVYASSTAALRADPGRIARRTAFSRFLQFGNSPDVNNPQALLAAVRRYIGARCHVEGSSLTATSIRDVVTQATQNTTLANTIAEKVRALEHTLYGGQSGQAPAPTFTELKSLLEAVEEETA